MNFDNIKIQKYIKELFFDKRNKYALIISVINNEEERFISQMNKMKEANIFLYLQYIYL